MRTASLIVAAAAAAAAVACCSCCWLSCYLCVCRVEWGVVRDGGSGACTEGIYAPAACGSSLPYIHPTQRQPYQMNQIQSIHSHGPNRPCLAPVQHDQHTPPIPALSKAGA